jgi:UDP-N-acetylglucosamine:LPS N-acetylglucosamine transferase
MATHLLGDRLPTQRIAIVFFDAGGGHRNAATALQVEIQRQGLPFEVSLVNLQEILDSLDILRKLTGLRIQNLYNRMLRNGWTLGSPQLLRVLQAVVRMYHKPTVKMLEDYWRTTEPDMVISVVPHFNRAFRESLDAVFPGKPFVTILTDLADYPPHFWMERQPQYVICGTEHAIEQARATGHDNGSALRASGMILHPRFYEPEPQDRIAERRKLGLDPHLPTGIVLFGGYGSWKMHEILQSLDRSSLEMQLILICGRNEKLTQALRAQKTRMPIHVQGFTTEIPFYMALSDFFIGKPGPGSISEALAKRLPVIIDCNAWTLPQERYNAQWIREKEVGLVLRNHGEIVSAVSELLKPGQLLRFRERAAGLQNRAIFEIPEMLSQIFAKTPMERSGVQPVAK